MERFRSAVRPAVTIAFVGAFLVYAHFDPAAFDRIKETAIGVTLFWFGTRASK